MAVQQHTDTYTHTHNNTYTHTTTHRHRHTHTHTTNTHTTTHRHRHTHIQQTHTHTPNTHTHTQHTHPPWFHVAGVAQPHIYRRFAWQAWDRWHWVARLDWFRRRRDARDAAPLLRGRRGTWWHPPWFHVAGVAQPHIYRRFAWPAWDRWHWVARLDWFRRRRDARDAAPLLRGSRGTWWHPPWFHVAGVAQPHIYRRFAWPAWDRWHWVARLDWFRRRRDARDAAPLLRGSRGTWWHPPWFHVAGVAQPHIYRRFAWQAWDRWHWMARLDWFRRRRDARDAAPLLRGRRGTWWHPPWFHVAGVAQPHIYRRFAWQAWDRWHSQPHIYRRFAWQAWDRWHWVACLDWFRRRRDACDAASLLRGRRGAWWHPPWFHAWQAWHNLTSTVVLRGRRGTDGTGWRAWTGLGAAVTPVTPRHFCVAGVALGDIHLDFTWQAWHNLISTVVLRGRRGTDGTGWRAWTGLGAAVTPVTPRRCLRGRRGTWRHGSPLCMAGVALMALGWLWWGAWFPVGAVDAAAVCVEGVALGDIERHFAWQAWHLATWTSTLRGKRGTSGTLRGRRGHLDFAWPAWHLVTSTSFVFPSFPVGMITSHKACRKSWQNLRLHSAEHYIQTYMHTYIHTIFSHTIFLCHTRSFTYNFAPRNSFNFSILHHLLCLSFLPRPATTFVAHGPHTHTPHTQLITTQLPHAQLTHTRVPCCTRQSFTISFLFPAFPMPSLTSFRACWKKLTCGVIRSFNFNIYFTYLDIDSRFKAGHSLAVLSLDNLRPRPNRLKPTCDTRSLYYHSSDETRLRHSRLVKETN